MLDYRRLLTVSMEKAIDVEGFCSFYYFENDANFIFSGERHDCWEIVYVDSGEVYATADNTGYLLTQGSVIFHKPMEFHALASHDGLPNNIVVTTFLCRSRAMEFFKNKVFRLNTTEKNHLFMFVKEMKRVFLRYGLVWENGMKNYEEHPAAYQMACAYFELFLLELMRQNTGQPRRHCEYSAAKKNIDNAFVASIKSYLAEHLHQALTLSDICAHFHVSRSYVCLRFKNVTGQSVIDYYIALKMDEAKRLIREGRLNVTQISETLGYSGIHHFTRTFKNKTGTSPSAYEQSLREPAGNRQN